MPAPKKDNAGAPGASARNAKAPKKSAPKKDTTKPEKVTKKRPRFEEEEDKAEVNKFSALATSKPAKKKVKTTDQSEEEKVPKKASKRASAKKAEEKQDQSDMEASEGIKKAPKKAGKKQDVAESSEGTKKASKKTSQKKETALEKSKDEKSDMETSGTKKAAKKAGKKDVESSKDSKNGKSKPVQLQSGEEDADEGFKAPKGVAKKGGKKATAAKKATEAKPKEDDDVDINMDSSDESSGYSDADELSFSGASENTDASSVDDFKTGKLNLRVDPQTEAKMLEKLSAKKKKNEPKEKGINHERGVIYIGHIPHGFYEEQMKAYFTQFGDVTRLKLSRSKRTGKSKGYAFVEFADADVAKIVAESFHNYLMFTRRIICKVVETEDLHEQTFEGANERFWNRPKQMRVRHQWLKEKAKTEEEIDKLNEKAKKKDLAKRKQIAELGMDFTPPALTKPE